MIPKLTSEQRDAIYRRGTPVAVEDPESRKIYFLVDSAMLESLHDQGDIASILQGLADAESGRMMPVAEAFRKIEDVLKTRFAK